MFKVTYKDLSETTLYSGVNKEIPSIGDEVEFGVSPVVFTVKSIRLFPSSSTKTSTAVTIYVQRTAQFLN